MPVHVNNDGHKFDTIIIAGSLGITGSSTGRLLETEETGLDTLQPVAGWLISEKLEVMRRDLEEVRLKEVMKRYWDAI